MRLESAIKQFNSFRTEVKIKVIFFSGLLINLSTGTLIIVAYYELSSRKFENWVEAINVAPSFISVIFLVDAMRRLKNIVKSKFTIDTWQFFWHMISYVLLAASALLLEVDSRHAWKKPKRYYSIYEAFIVTILFSQLPFIYILNRLVS